MTDKDKLNKLMNAVEEILEALKESGHDDCFDCGVWYGTKHHSYCSVEKLTNTYNECKNE